MLPTYEEFFSVLAERHGRERQEKFAKARVVIFGLGGLGSHIAMLLARAGVGMGESGQIHLIDFDRVDLSNIHRQNYLLTDLGKEKPLALKDYLLQLNPYLHLNTTVEKVTPKRMGELMSGNHLVCEAFDVAETKAELVDVFFSQKEEGQCLFSGSGMAGFGDGNEILSRKVNDSFYLVGDCHSDVKEAGSLVATRVSLCASAQAHCMLQYLSGG